MTASTSTSSVELTAGTQGTVLRPGDAGWDAARTPWVINAAHDPAAVAVVTTAEDVVATVQSAAACGLRVLAEGTGHGAMPVGSLADTVLLRTAALKTVDVDPATRSAWVGAGAEWGHGVRSRCGARPCRAGRLGRRRRGRRFPAVRRRQLACPQPRLGSERHPGRGDGGCRGAIRVVDAAANPDLFWAIRGGGGGLGVVTRFRLRLHTVPTIVAGTLFFPIGAWRGGAPRLAALDDQRSGANHELRTAAAVPAASRATRSSSRAGFVSVEIVHQGEPAELAELVCPLRELGPVIDTIAVIPAPTAGRAAP